MTALACVLAIALWRAQVQGVSSDQSVPDRIVIESKPVWQKTMESKAQPPAEGYSSWDELAFADLLENELAGKAKKLALTVEDCTKLSTTVVEAAGAYWTSDAERYRNLLRAEGVPLLPSLEGSAGDRLMETSTRSICDAPFRHSQITVDVLPPEPNRVTQVLTRKVIGGRFMLPDRLPDDPDIFAKAEKVVVISIPVQAQDGLTAEPVYAIFKLFLARRESDESWIFVGFLFGSDAAKAVAGGNKTVPVILQPPI